MSTNAGTAVATASKETDFVLLNALPQEMVAKAQILCVHIRVQVAVPACFCDSGCFLIPNLTPPHPLTTEAPTRPLAPPPPPLASCSPAKDKAFHGVVMSILGYIYAMKHQVKERTWPLSPWLPTVLPTVLPTSLATSTHSHTAPPVSQASSGSGCRPWA